MLTPLRKFLVIGVLPIINLNEEILTATENIAIEFRGTFFETKLLQHQVFDDNHFNMVIYDAQKSPQCPQHALLEDELTECDTTIRIDTKCSSMVNDEFDQRMFKHFELKFKSVILVGRAFTPNVGRDRIGCEYSKKISAEKRSKNFTYSGLVSDLWLLAVIFVVFLREYLNAGRKIGLKQTTA